MRAVLSVESGECSTTALDLHPAIPASLGLNRDNSHFIRYYLASRLHAKVYFQDGKWFVRDFGLNGTRVNDIRVAGAVPLADGSVVQIGECRLKFSTVTSAATPMTGNPDALRRLKPDAGSSVRPLPPPAIAMPPGRKAEAVPTKAIPPQERTAEMPSLPVDPPTPGDPLKVDELTALCRFMSNAVEADDPHDVTRLALQAI